MFSAALTVTLQAPDRPTLDGNRQLRTPAIRQLPNKSCAADPVPTSVLKQLTDDVVPFLTTVFNRSLTEGVVRQRSSWRLSRRV